MSRTYTNIEHLASEVFSRKAAGETNREIAESYNLTLAQIRNLVFRQNRKSRRIAQGYIPRKKGRPVKDLQNEEIIKTNEIIALQMQVEILRNFLLEVGRM